MVNDRKNLSAKVRSQKIIILCLIFIIFSNILALSSINEKKNQDKSQTPIEVDIPKPQADFQTYNELWIDDGMYTCGNGTWAYITEMYSWCVDVNGDGSLYLIEDITLNNPDGVGSPLTIANSTVDFIIQNCTFTNSDAVYGNAGITLLNASNGNIYSCNISNNNGKGIMLYEYCANITIKNNTINHNEEGIYIRWNNYPNNYAINNTIIDCTDNGIAMFEDGSIAENNTIVGGAECIAADGDNIVIRNNILSGAHNGIYAAAFSNNLTISGNTMTNVGINLTHNGDGFRTMEIFTNNTVNGKPVYYYKDQIGLDTANFTSVGDPGQILLFNCSYSTISNFNISYTSMGIQLIYHSCHNNITHNRLRNNDYGIKLSYDCHNNTIMNNTLNDSFYNNIQLMYYNKNNTIIDNSVTGGGYGIQLYHLSDDNEITNNNVYDGNSGIVVWNCDNVNVTHNIANENNRGILITANTANSFVYNNTCNDNSNEGIYLDGAGINNLILENNCTDTAAGLPQARGIYLRSTETNDIINNTIHGNKDEGIFVQSNCEYNNLSFNDIRFGNGDGIHLAGACYNNTIYKNNISENSNYGIQIYAYSDDTSILENEIINNGYSGVYLADSDNNYVYNNEIINNGYSGANHGGILIKVLFYTALWNNITDNVILLNDDFGIYLSNYADWNNITMNDIKNNTYGIFTESETDYNMINLNNFTDNTIHAWEQSSDNYWNNETCGNYWDNYTGIDYDDDGIGDTPHVIPGGGGAQDNKPIWWDGVNSPVIIINSPSEGQVCNSTVPIFDILITGIGIDEQWFSFFNGSVWTNNATWTGVEIDQNLWNTAGNGTVMVRFWANNSKGEKLEERSLYKDILAPNLVIINPVNYSVRKNSDRDFNFTIQEGNLDKMWYTIKGVGHFEFTQNGTFDEDGWDTAWEATSDGEIFTVRFYANDTAGNIKFVDIIITVDKSDDKVDDDDEGPGNDKLDEDNPFNSQITLVFIIGSITTASILTLYYYNNKVRPKKVRKMRNPIKSNPSLHSSKDILDELNDQNKLMLLFNEKVAPEQIEENAVTFLSDEFLSKIDKSGLTGSEKREFLKEMLALQPDVRNEIIDNILKKRNT